MYRKNIQLRWDMKEFAIKITETLEKTVIVEAENEREALQLVDDNYRAAKEGYVLDSENFTGVEFKPIDLKVN